MADMTVLALIEGRTGDEEVDQFLADVPPINLFKAMAHAPAVARGVAELGGRILYQTSFDPGLREIAILRAAARAGSDYELAHHRRIGRDVGLTDTEIGEAISGSVETLSDDGRLVCAWADHIVDHGRPTPEMTAEAVDRFGVRQAVELQITIAYYLMVASFLETFQVPLEPADFADGVDVSQEPEALD